MSNTTSIHELPLDPAGGNEQSNVQMSASETMPVQGPIHTPPQNAPGMTTSPQTTTLDKESINSIVTGLQKASASGVTQLMSRDMPTSSTHISQDEQIQPNFIPSPENSEDYLEKEEDDEDIIDAYNSKVQSESRFDKIYEDLQTPIMLAILFFLFQLPFLKKQLFIFVPALFMSDGNYNLYGFLVISIIFATVYHLISKTLNLFNTF